MADKPVSGGLIDTTPTLPEPPTTLIEAAMCRIPEVLSGAPQNQSGEFELVASFLAKKLEGLGHIPAAAKWAIHHWVKRGYLRPETITTTLPGVLKNVNGTPEVLGGHRGTIVIPKGKPAPFDSFKVVATEKLWESWRQEKLRTNPIIPNGITSPNLAIAQAEMAADLKRSQEIRAAKLSKDELVYYVTEEFNIVFQEWAAFTRNTDFSHSNSIETFPVYEKKFFSVLQEIGKRIQNNYYSSRLKLADHEINFHYCKGAEYGGSWHNSRSMPLSRARYDEAVRILTSMAEGTLTLEVLRPAIETEELMGTLTYLGILLSGLIELQRFDLKQDNTTDIPTNIESAVPETKSKTLTHKKQKDSAPTTTNDDVTLETSLGDNALRELLMVFTNGISDDRIVKASKLLLDDKLTVNVKLTKINELICFPATASAEKLGEMLRVTKQAVLKTDWWSQNRKGEKDNEIGRRRTGHKNRAENYEPPGKRVDNELR